MERNIVQIGNSMGVILPASILKRLNLSAKDPVTITHRNNSIITVSYTHLTLPTT